MRRSVKRRRRDEATHCSGTSNRDRHLVVGTSRHYGDDVKPADLPQHRVLTRRELGTHYMVHAIECDGTLIHSQIGPYGDGEVEQRVRAYVTSGSASPTTVKTIPPLPGYVWRDGRKRRKQ